MTLHTISSLKTRFLFLQCIAAAYLMKVSFGWVPPLDHTNFESVHDMRRRLGIEYNYDPHFVHHEMCRFRSEEDCHAMDESLMDHACRSMARSGGSRGRDEAHKVLVVPVYFSDHNPNDLPDVSHYNDLWNGPIADWFNVNSHGRQRLDAVVVDQWSAINDTEAFWARNISGYHSRLQEAFWPILDSLDGTLDLGDFDTDRDRWLDNVVFIHSGFGAELECEGFDQRNQIWSKAEGINKREEIWSSQYGIRLDAFVLASAFSTSCRPEPADISIMIHEFMHLFGVPDLYDDGPEGARGWGVGGFDIMGYAYGPQNNPANPGHLSVWSKYELGWVTPQEIRDDGVYTLRPAETHSDFFIIRDWFSSFEYIAIENRQQIEYDTDLWGNGLVVYHIDGNAQAQHRRGFPGQSVQGDGTSWPSNGRHYEVAVLSADGRYDLERGENPGDADDFWQPGMVLGPGDNNRVFPNTDSYQNGDIFETLIVIRVLEQNGRDITIDVCGLTEWVCPMDPPPVPTLPPTYAATRPPTDPPTPSPTDAITRPPTDPPTPSPTDVPTKMPTKSPTRQVTRRPTTQRPTQAPQPEVPSPRVTRAQAVCTSPESMPLLEQLAATTDTVAPPAPTPTMPIQSSAAATSVKMVWKLCITSVMLWGLFLS